MKARRLEDYRRQYDAVMEKERKRWRPPGEEVISYEKWLEAQLLAAEICNALADKYLRPYWDPKKTVRTLTDQLRCGFAIEHPEINYVEYLESAIASFHDSNLRLKREVARLKSVLAKRGV